MPDNILNPVVIGMLKEMETVFAAHGVDFYLVGAIARDIQLSQKPGYGAIRATNDIDLAILLASEEQFYEVKNSLLTTGSFTERGSEPIRLLYREAVEVDLLPFGAIENEVRETRIRKPKAFVMDMPGFQEAYASVTRFSADGLIVNVCSLEGIVLLKLIAQDDRPSRTKDISDIEHIIHVYFDLFADAIYSDHSDVLELYDTALVDYLSLVSAQVIGRKMKSLLIHSPQVLKRVEAILQKRPTAAWNAMLAGLTGE